MEYAPFQSWITGKVLKTPSVFQRNKSQITDYDPVYTGNVVPGEVDITDPGQLGRSNLPSLHNAGNIRDRHVDTILPQTEQLADFGTRTARWVGLRGGNYNPFMFTDMDNTTTEYVATPAHGQNPFGPAGAGRHAGDPGEHGPISVHELEVGLNVRQPRNLRRRSFLRALFFLPPETLDETATRDERVIAQVGDEEKDTPRFSDASVGTGIAFTIPDIRRTFDQPKDAPASVPRDPSGNPIIRKAGYQLTNTSLEPIPHDIQTSHSYRNYNDLTELPVGSVQDRVRAGVQYDWQATRPAVMPHWYDFRPFDQLMAHHNYGLKGQLRPPSASRPVLTQNDTQSDIPWAPGRRYTMPPAGMSALGVLPNIDRQSPQAWDNGLYLEPQGSIDPRAAAWRLS